jgi:hypothetical protein
MSSSYRLAEYSQVIQDYNTLGEYTSERKLQVKTTKDGAILEFSVGDSRSTLGWLVQAATRTYNNMSGNALAHRYAVVKHIFHRTKQMKEQLSSIESCLPEADNVNVLRSIPEDLAGIRKSLESALIGLKGLKEVYKEEPNPTIGNDLEELKDSYREQQSIRAQLEDIRLEIWSLSHDKIELGYQAYDLRNSELCKTYQAQIDREKARIAATEESFQKAIQDLLEKNSP